MPPRELRKYLYNVAAASGRSIVLNRPRPAGDIFISPPADSLRCSTPKAG